MQEKLYNNDYLFEQIKNGSVNFTEKYNYFFVNQFFIRNELARENRYTIEYLNQFDRKISIILFIRDDNKITINLQLFNTGQEKFAPLSMSNYLYKTMPHNLWSDFWFLRFSNDVLLSRKINDFFVKLMKLIDENSQLNSIIKGELWIEISTDWNDYYR